MEHRKIQRIKRPFRADTDNNDRRINLFQKSLKRGPFKLAICCFEEPEKKREREREREWGHGLKHFHHKTGGKTRHSTHTFGSVKWAKSMRNKRDIERQWTIWCGHRYRERAGSNLCVSRSQPVPVIFMISIKKKKNDESDGASSGTEHLRPSHRRKIGIRHHQTDRLLFRGED